jgi:general secretion pathway protein N
MRIEAIGLRTWWLAGFAGWAAVMCLLALLGLGGRIQPLATDPALLQRLPALPAPATERLGPLSQYRQISAQPVFAEDRQPHPFFLSGDDTGGAAAQLRLTGVLITPQLQMATLTTEQGQSLRLRLHGDAVKGWRLLALQPRSASVEGPNGALTLELQVFSGEGRAAPGGTPAAAASAGDSADDGAAAKSQPQSQNPAEAGPTLPASGSESPAPAAEQLQAIRERIEARRRQMQQRQNGAAASDNNP